MGLLLLHADMQIALSSPFLLSPPLLAYAHLSLVSSSSSSPAVITSGAPPPPQCPWKKEGEKLACEKIQSSFAGSLFRMLQSLSFVTVCSTYEDEGRKAWNHHLAHTYVHTCVPTFCVRKEEKERYLILNLKSAPSSNWTS